MKFVQIELLPKENFNLFLISLAEVAILPVNSENITFRSDSADKGTLLQPGQILISRSTILIRWLDHPGRCGIGTST